jgi:hypothetical protein
MTDWEKVLRSMYSARERNEQNLAREIERANQNRKMIEEVIEAIEERIAKDELRENAA